MRWLPSPSLYLTPGYESVSPWEPKRNGAGKTQRQRPSSGATQSPLTSMYIPSTSAPSIVFTPTSSVYFGSLRLRVTFPSSRYNPMTVYLLPGSAHDLVVAVYDVGKASRLRFSHQLAPGCLIPLKPLSGFTSRSQPPSSFSLEIPSQDPV